MNRRTLTFLTALLLMLTVSLVGAPIFTRATVRAEPATPPELRVTTEQDRVRLEWSSDPAATPQATSLPDLPLVEIGGLQLPAELVALRITGEDAIVPRLEHIAAVPWAGTAAAIRAVPSPVPQPIDGEPRPDLATAPDRRLPTAPVVLLREGRMRGERVAVVALSPLFTQNGTIQQASNIVATIDGAEPLAAPGPLLETFANSAPFLDAAEAPPPRNTQATQPAYTIHVASAGMQRITGAALAAAGLDRTSVTSYSLRLWHNGTAVALEEYGTADGSLDDGDELRFYAPEPGDRWNAATTYWLTLEQQPGPRILTRTLETGTAPLRPTARERGVWRANSIYDSTLPGPDGDHWFAAELRSGPGLPAATVSVPLTPTLPLADATATAPVTLTLAGSAYTTGTHRLAVQMGSEVQTVGWSGTGDWSHTIAFTISNAPAIEVRLLPGATPAGIELDNVAWDRPVILDAAGQGVSFGSLPGLWRYQVDSLPTASALYDISLASAPVRLTAAADAAPGVPLIFQAGPAPRSYLLAGPGTLHEPAVAAHQPVSLTSMTGSTDPEGLSGADVIYIAPASLHAALEPLLAHRRSQGYTVALVDVQHIYAAWSYGQVAPDAIRDFLRYAAATWNPAPTAVVLVGDGTSDPLNYTGRDAPDATPSYIPPYLAPVDPWLIETACDICYAQLDGSDPLADPLPDLRIGRLPVRTADDLTALVAKLVGYETLPGHAAWRSRMVYLTDNYLDADGTPDGGGDFPSAARAAAALQPAGVENVLLSYDPSPAGQGQPGREPDAVQAHTRALALFNAGASVLTFIGHSHHWQWASTDLQAEHPYLVGLLDAGKLTNGERLPIVLAMTCLSSAFQTPAYGGTTIDERLVLNRQGGAIAVWGPTGLGVAYGHDRLQHGFSTALWQPGGSRTLGTLVQAGYLDLFTQGRCCQDAIQTFVLLGDPLTTARVAAGTWELFLPILRR